MSRNRVILFILIGSIGFNVLFMGYMLSQGTEGDSEALATVVTGLTSSVIAVIALTQSGHLVRSETRPTQSEKYSINEYIEKKIIGDFDKYLSARREVVDAPFYSLQYEVATSEDVANQAVSVTRNARIILLGSAGSGKSVAIRQIGLHIAQMYLNEETRFIPFFIDLSSVDNPHDPEKLIEHWWEKSGLPVDERELLVTRGDIIFLFDGLNEMPDKRGSGSFQSRLGQLRTFLDLAPYAGPYVMTCRQVDHASYGKYGKSIGLEQVYIPTLPARHIRNITYRMMREERDAFLKHVVRDWRRVELAENALALNLLTTLYKSTKRLPYDFESLYAKYMELLYRLRRSEINTPLEKLEQGLSDIACDMMLRGVTETSITEIRHPTAPLGIVKRYPKQLISDGVSLGLVIKETIDDGNVKIKFLHQTWYEYFALPIVKEIEDGLVLRGRRRKEDIIYSIGQLGTFATSTLVALTNQYLKLKPDHPLKPVYRTAIINIALEQDTMDGAVFTVLILLESIVDIIENDNFARTGEYEKFPTAHIQELEARLADALNQDRREKKNLSKILFDTKRNDWLQQHNLRAPDEAEVFEAELLNKDGAYRLRQRYDKFRSLKDPRYTEEVGDAYNGYFLRTRKAFQDLRHDKTWETTIALRKHLAVLYVVFVDENQKRVTVSDVCNLKSGAFQSAILKRAKYIQKDRRRKKPQAAATR